MAHENCNHGPAIPSERFGIESSNILSVVFQMTQEPTEAIDKAGNILDAVSPGDLVTIEGALLLAFAAGAMTASRAINANLN
jgi:hypothetical protein